MSWLLGALAGLLTGVLSGFGIGGGTLLILWLTLVQQMDQLRAGGVNLLYFIACALPALWGHAKNGLLEKRAVFWCAAGGVPASIAGALLASWQDMGLLRRFFGVFLLAVGLREVFHRRKPGGQRSR